MRIQNKASAWGFLAGALVMLLGLVVNCGCYAGVHTRMVQAQYDAGVDISVVCFTKDSTLQMWGGSGVIVDSSHVLTAGHVANAQGAMCSYTVTDIYEKQHMMFVKNLDTVHDLASLELSLGEAPFAAAGVRFGVKPRLGDHVCASTANPWRLHKCGEVQPYVDPPGDILLDIVVEPGNSGSGLYNDDGELVGIVTHRRDCANGQWCGGKAASLAGHLKDLL